jgi:hypothetical protein
MHGAHTGENMAEILTTIKEPRIKQGILKITAADANSC